MRYSRGITASPDVISGEGQDLDIVKVSLRNM